MKRHANLFPQVIARDNLGLAFWKAGRGKWHRPSVQRFTARLDKQLLTIGEQLQNHIFPFGKWYRFTIRDPKVRHISAPSFAERVVHHALFNVTEPIFHRLAIADTFACFQGRGQIKAVRRAQHFSRSHRWYLKLDIRKYFDSICHNLLRTQLQRKFKDPDLLSLFGQIIDSYSTTGGHGLPIGSLASQHLANYFLNPFDHFVKHTLRVRGYVRYMDDMIVWSNDKATIKRIAERCGCFLAEELALETKHAYWNRTRVGVSFLGLRVFPSSLRLGHRAKRNARKRYQRYCHQFHHQALDEDELQRRLCSLVAWLDGADTMEFRKRLFAQNGVGPINSSV